MWDIDRMQTGHQGCWMFCCRQLTRAILADDYGVDWWVPDAHLIPPVTNRANYIHWLHGLLKLCPGTADRVHGCVFSERVGCQGTGCDGAICSCLWPLQCVRTVKRQMTTSSRSGLSTCAFNTWFCWQHGRQA